MTLVPRRRAYLGSDSVWYCENSSGHIFLTTQYSEIPEGFIRKVADTASDAEKVWKKIDDQEKAEFSRLTEQDYNRRASKIQTFRSRLQNRMTEADCSEFEKDCIRYALGFCDRKEDSLNRNTVYGVAAMQEKEAPLPPSVKKVVMTDAS